MEVLFVKVQMNQTVIRAVTREPPGTAVAALSESGELVGIGMRVSARAMASPEHRALEFETLQSQLLSRSGTAGIAGEAVSHLSSAVDSFSQKWGHDVAAVGDGFVFVSAGLGTVKAIKDDDVIKLTLEGTRFGLAALDLLNKTGTISLGPYGTAAVELIQVGLTIGSAVRAAHKHDPDASGP
jgi:hypothetical protein